MCGEQQGHLQYLSFPFSSLFLTLFPFLLFFTHVYQLMANLLAFLCPSVLHALMFVALGTLVFLSIPTPTVQPIPSVYRFRDYALAKTSHFFTNAARFTLVVLLPLGIQVLELVQVEAYSPIRVHIELNHMLLEIDLPQFFTTRFRRNCI